MVFWVYLTGMTEVVKRRRGIEGIVRSPAPPIRDAHRALSRQVAAELKDRGIEVLTFRYTYTLLEEDGISQAEIADRLSLDRATVTVQLDTLEGQGILVRKPHPTDRRKTNVFLTPRGRRLKPRIIEAVNAAHDVIFAGMPPTALDHVHTLLEKMIANVDRHQSERNRRTA